MSCHLKIQVVFMYGTGDPKKTEHLLSLDGAKEGLHLFKANLLEEGAFDSVVDGCECVFHTASPVTLTAKDPQVSLFKHSHIIYAAIMDLKKINIRVTWSVLL